MLYPEDYDEKLSKSDDVASLEDDELEVEQFMDLGLCKFESIQIRSASNSSVDKHGFILYKTNRLPIIEPALVA